MGTLLHMSDLHLAPEGDRADITGDYKLDLVPWAERQRRTADIRSTLKQLSKSFAGSRMTLDAIVISGDVTVRGRVEGIDLLDSVLDELGDALPTKDRILIVPGNHDVVWGTDPSSAERYENFLRLRAAGYRTAYLEGVDTDGDELRAGLTGTHEPVVVATDNSFVVVGINSCDMCGVKLPVEADLSPRLGEVDTLALTNPAVAALQAAWNARGLHDVARVSRAQREICHGVAAHHRAAVLGGTDRAPVMIAAFHHQLRPVSTAEEFKTFEGITNLGEVREWLAGNGFDILLHGHKHENRVIEDLFVPYGTDTNAVSHSLHVVSAPTIGLGQPATNPVARLITINAEMPRVSPVLLHLVPTRKAGVPINFGELHREEIVVGSDDGPRVGVIEGDVVADVYDQIRALEDQLGSLPTPLVCRFRDGASALELPKNYPDVGFATESSSIDEARSKLESWFGQTVDWWERSQRGQAAPFNHGERIKGQSAGDPSQFTSAIASLRSNGGTSRAVILVVNPSDFDDSNTPFPAFVTVQMLVRDGALEMIGYFRKQEMPHWWPINVAELARLQHEAIEELRAKGTHLTSGQITTITAIPVAGDSAPKVVIPDVDRRVEEPGSFLELLVPLYFGGVAKTEMVSRWGQVIDDWRPRDKIAADGDPVPVLGFTRLWELAEACDAMNSHQGGGTVANPEPGTRLVGLLRQLRDANEFYAREQAGADRINQHKRWRESVDEIVAKIYGTVEEMADTHVVG